MTKLDLHDKTVYPNDYMTTHNHLALEVLKAIYEVLIARRSFPDCSFEDWIESGMWEKEIDFLSKFRSNEE